MVIYLELNFPVVVVGLCWCEFGLCSQQRVLRVKAEEPHGGDYCVFEVGFHLNASILANLPLLFSKADNTRGLSEVSLVGYDLDTTSFGNGNFTLVCTNIDADRDRGKLL